LKRIAWSPVDIVNCELQTCTAVVFTG